MTISKAPLQYSGLVKNNITRLPGTSTTINPTDTYQFADPNAWRVVTGWTAGTANVFFDENGVPLPSLGQKLINTGIGPRLYCGLKKIAAYKENQNTVLDKKIKRITGV